MNSSFHEQTDTNLQSNSKFKHGGVLTVSFSLSSCLLAINTHYFPLFTNKNNDIHISTILLPIFAVKLPQIRRIFASFAQKREFSVNFLCPSSGRCRRAIERRVLEQGTQPRASFKFEATHGVSNTQDYDRRSNPIPLKFCVFAYLK